MKEIYKISHLPWDSTPKEILVATPKPGESRVPVSRRGFPDFASGLEKAAEVLGGRIIVSLETVASSDDSLAIVSWREIKSDNLGTRFVRIEGPAKPLENPLFEIETPVTRFSLERLESGFPIIVPEHHKTLEGDRNFRLWVLNCFGKEEGEDALARMFTLEELGKKKAGVVKEDEEIGRERVRQILKNVLRHLHKNSPDYLKYRFPLGLLFDQIEKPSFMVDKRGTTRQIAGEVLQGASYQALRGKWPSLRDSLSGARTILSGYDLKVPYSPDLNKYQPLIDDLKAIRADDPAEKKQQLLERITDYFIEHYPKEYKTYCLSVSDLAREPVLDFSRRVSKRKLVVEALSKEGINFRILSKKVKPGKHKGLQGKHSILLAVDKKAALKAVKKELRNFNSH